MVYQTPFQAEDENDAEELDRIEQDSVDEADTEDLSARAKGSALDFSSFADPVPSSKASPARGGKPTALDFSGQADEITVPASPPLPRARPAQAAQPDLFAGQDVPLPQARPDSAPALETVPLPTPRPDIGPNPAGPGDVGELDDAGRFRDRYGSQKGMLTGEEAYGEYKAKITSAEQAVGEAETRLAAARERVSSIPNMRTARKRGSTAETQRLAIEAEVENAQKALDVANSGLSEARRSSPPTVGKLRDALTRAATATITGPIDIIGGAARPVDAALDAAFGTDTGIASAMRKGSEQVMREGATDPTRDKEFAAQVGAGAGSSLVFVLTGVLGRALGAGAGLSAGAAGGLQQAEQSYREADQLGVPAYKKALAYIAGGGIGATEGMIGLGRLPDVIASMDKATGGGVKRYFGLVAREMGEEGVQNGLQQLLQNIADFGILGKDPGDITKGVWEQALIGAVVGMGFTGVIGSPALLGGKDAVPPPPDVEQPSPDDIMRQARGEPPPPPPPGPGAPPAGAAPAAAEPQRESPAATVSPIERRVLRKKGWLDDQIDGMSRLEAEAELGEAAEQGVEADQETASETFQKQPQTVSETPDFSDQGVPADGAGTRESPAQVNDAVDVARAAAAASPDYSPQQGEANNRKLGHIKWQGLNGSVEVASGGARKGLNPETGETWETTHSVPYGYWKGTKGADGMHIDAYFGPEMDAGHPVYVIDENDPTTGKFRQHKTFAGFPSLEAAREAYLGTSSKTPEMVGGIATMPVGDFKKWLKAGTQTKAVATGEQAAADQPSAEPASDIEAQARDLVDPKSDRNAVWLPAATVEHLRSIGKLDEITKAGVPMENFDGQGGILVAKNKRIAQHARKLRTQKISIQAIVGGLSGSGLGKPPNAQTVVQQTDQAGNVTQETAVAPGEAQTAAADMAEPGRTTQEVPVGDALTTRAAKVEAEAAVADALTKAGIKPEAVDQADVTRAAEIVAQTGADPANAFEQATFENGLADGSITPADIQAVYGKEEADAVPADAKSGNVEAPARAGEHREGEQLSGAGEDGADQADDGGQNAKGVDAEDAGDQDTEGVEGDKVAVLAGLKAVDAKQPISDKVRKLLESDDVLTGSGKPLISVKGDKIKLTPLGRKWLTIAQKTARERAERDDKLARLPDPKDMPALITAYKAAIDDDHAAVMRGDQKAAAEANTRMDLIEERANGNTRLGVRTEESPARELRIAGAAPIGTVPKWGQEGVFEIEVDGTRYIVTQTNFVGDAIYAVDGESPFPSESGFRSMSAGRSFNDIKGKTVDQVWTDAIRAYVASEYGAGKKAKRGEKSGMPMPETWYRLPKSWKEEDGDPIPAGGKIYEYKASGQEAADTERGMEPEPTNERSEEETAEAMRERLLQPVEMQAEDSNETVTVRLTEKGPWDFNDTFPAPDFENVAARAMEGRETFGDDGGDLDVHQVVSTIEEAINEMIGYLSAVRGLRQKIADIRSGKEKVKKGSQAKAIETAEKEMRQQAQSLRDFAAALQDGFTREGVAAMMRKARGILASEKPPAQTPAEQRAEEKTAEPKTKKPKKPKGPSYLDRLENYFRVGRIHKAYSGFDKVIKFERLSDDSWQVQVQEVKNGEIVGHLRTHATGPSKKELETWEKQHPVPAPAATEDTTKAPETGPSDSGELAKANETAKLAAKFVEHLRDGGEFNNILVARKMAKEAGFGEDAKAVEEAMELAVVQLGREIAAGTDDAKAKFVAMVDLYSRQPKLGTRTSTSMRDQAFSTPIPLAYVASRLAGIDDMEAEVIYEPTAGNGALLVEANASPDIGAKTVIANEINPQRADNLRSIAGLLKGVKPEKQGFQVTSVDATDPSQAKAIRQEMDGADRVIANPPFGAVRQENESKVFDLSDIQKGYQTKEIDHAIALRALSALRDDGKAVLILGGLNKLAASREARSDGYNGKAKREFYKTLYDRYNVTDHFTVAGELYERQGAGWPVDVIVIDGRGKSKRALPAVDVPRVLSSWDQLGGLIDAVPGTGVEQADVNAGRAPEGRPGERDVGVRDAGERVSKPEPEAGQPGAVQPGSSQRSGDERSGGAGQGKPARAQRGDAERTGVEPAPERRPPGLDDFDAAFEAGLDETFGPQAGPKLSQAPRARATGEVAKSAASNAVQSADAAMAGLVQLFGGGKNIGSGLSFDEDTYTKAKPLFVTAAQKFVAFKDDVAELVKRMVGEMHRVHGLTRDALEAMRPYLRRFMEEVKSGVVSLTGAQPAAKPAAAKSAAAPAQQEQETGTQVTYAPKSAVNGLGTLVPVNMRTPINESLAELAERVGGLDAYVAEQLGYSVDQLPDYFAAEQVDALALAIDNLERGKGFIIGDQCVAGETRIFDPITRTHTAIKELAEAGKAITVLSITPRGLKMAQASAPFRKGIADLYRVTLEDGRAICVTSGHRFLTPSGWSSLDAGLHVGHFLASAEGHPARNLASCPSVHREDALRCSGTVPACQGRFPTSPRCDAQLRSAEDSDRASFPSPADALGRSRYYSREDGPASSRGYSRLNRSSGHQPKNSSSPSWSRDLSPTYSRAISSLASMSRSILRSDLRSHGGAASLHQECGAALLDRRAGDEGYSIRHETGSTSPQPVRTSSRGNSSRSLRDTHEEGLLRSGKERAIQPVFEALDTPCDFPLEDHTGWKQIVAIEFVRRDEFFDMAVAGTANYVAEGIINHNTGIGKGRVNAAIIRWAIKRGRIPVFVTEKPNLYRDMYRDLNDIGISDGFLDGEPRILATNSDLTVPLTEDGDVTLKTGGSSEHGRLLGTMTAKKFGANYDMVFTTYSQMQTVAGNDTTRRAFLAGIAPNAVLIFDESHNAGGQGKAAAKPKAGQASNRSGFARDLVAAANGVFYSSATYAKRPDVMDLYSATDMVMAVEKVSDLAEAIARGGVPMQQVVASMLAKAGQYIRRERSFAGVTYDTPIIPVDKEQYDGISRALAEIQDFSLIVNDAAKSLDADVKAQASAIMGDNATGSAGASSVLFTSIMHNIVNQMLLAMKAGPVAQRAIAAIREGKKPVITLANTMESFLSDYAEAAGIKHGDVLDADFSKVLQKYLDRTRTLIIKKPFSDTPVERKYLTDEELGKEGVEAYNRAKEVIDGLVLTDLPVSPIDRIKQDLADAGYRVGEITGRGTVMDYSGDEPVIRGRSTRETSIKGRLDTISKFNSGDLDAVILNQSGATGLSLHASKTFKDQRQRKMMIAQAEANIDTHMQMLGRVHRTGQVIVPEYDQLVADIPAEKRPAAVLAKKMASLNANTTASRGGALTAKDVPDFLNEYGDIVAATIIADDIVLNIRMGSPVKIDGDTGKVTVEDAMRRLTGRIPLLPLKEQEDLYERLEADYAALLEQMEASGENALEAKTLDYKARPLERVQVVPAKKGSKSPFAAPVYIEKTSILRQGKPFSAMELMNRLGEQLGATGPMTADELNPGDTEDGTAANMLADLQDHFGVWGQIARTRHGEASQAAIEEFTDYVREELDGLTSAEKQEKERTKLYAVKDRWVDIFSALPTGARITLKTNSGNIAAIVIKTERTGQAKNPLALSSWKVTFAVADAARQVTLPFSRLFQDGKSPSEDKTAVELRQVGWQETPAQTIERFAMMQNSAREERYIATGNLLAAYDWLNMRGRIINYTDEEGHIRQGILTAKDFDVAEHFGNKATPIRDAAEVVAWVKNNPGKPIWSKDDIVRLNLEHRRFYITVEAAKRTGGVFYLDQQLTDLTRDFYKRGAMVADMFDPSDATMVKVVERLQQLGAVFVDRSQSKLPESEKIAPAPKPDEMASIARFDASSDLTPAARQRRADIERLLIDAVRSIAGPGIRVQFSDTIPIKNTKGWGSAGAEAATAAGSYIPAEGLVKLALADPAYTGNPLSTAFHEAFHGVEDRLLTPQEQALMQRETPRLRAWLNENVTFTAPDGAKADTGWADDIAGYEVRAIAFETYAMRRASGQPLAGMHIGVRRTFDKLAQFFQRIANALRGLGFRTAEDIFSAVYLGQMSGRAPRQRNAAAAPQASIRRRAPQDGDLMPLPETVREAWDPSVPFKQRLSDALDALLLTPARALWDRQIDLLRFQKASEAMGRRISESLDTYLAATLYPGKVGERMKDAVKKLWEPLYDAMKERSVGRDELHDYLYARHAPERNAKIREIDPNNDAGSGMTDDEATEIMANLDDRRADFEAVAALVDKIIEANRDVIVREGLETERTVSAWEAAYKHYVPLKGFEAGTDDEMIGSPSSGRGFDVRRPETMRALGRFDRADDILTNLLDQTQRTIIRAEKNRVAKTFLRFAQTNPSPFYKIGLGEKKRRIDPLTGLVEEYHANLPTHMDRVFAAKVGGKTFYIEIKHGGLLEALKTLGADKMNAFLRVMARLTREYSRFQTAKNPEFVFTNIVRDIQDAGFTVTAEQKERYTRRFFANIANGKALFGAILGTADKGENTQYRRWFEEWREAGGKISHYGLKDMEELRKEVERELAQRTESTGKSIAMAPLRMVNPINGKLVKFLEALSDVTESTTRLAVYISGREIGLTKAQAARMARSATVDFNRRGVHGSMIGALYAFANANIQGNIRLLRVLRKSKTARRGAMAIVVAGMLMAFWNMAVSPEDEDKKRAYEKRKYWERERNIIIYWPGSKVAAKIPLGYGLNVFWMMGEQIAMRMLGKVNTTEAIGNLMGTMVDAFNPTGSQGSFFDLATWAKGLFPTVLRPIPELALNKNWAGNRIHPDAMPWTDGIPHSSQHKAFTHPAAVAMAEMTNRLTGGNKFQPGAVSLYPDDVEHVWNFATGGLGRFLANTSGTISDVVDGVDRPVERIPFVRRFVASDNSPSIQSSAYYDKRREEQVKARQLRAAIKARTEGTDDGSADAVIEKLAPQVGARPSKNGKGINTQSESIFRDADKQIKALRQQEDAIRKNSSIARSERETQIRALREQMREIMSRARSLVPSKDR